MRLPALLLVPVLMLCAQGALAQETPVRTATLVVDTHVFVNAEHMVRKPLTIAVQYRDDGVDLCEAIATDGSPEHALAEQKVEEMVKALFNMEFGGRFWLNCSNQIRSTHKDIPAEASGG